MNINSITVNKYPVSQMLDPEGKAVYEIPKYQREYVWGIKQWEALYDDLQENKEGYFLGSIICINSGDDIINSLKIEVVDGQQRLTTLSLFIAAMYTVLNDYRDQLDDEQLSDVLQLKRKLVLKGTASNVRIIPQTQGNNLDDYLGVLAEKKIISPRKMPKFAGNRRIVKAYNYFKNRIEDTISNKEDKTTELFKILAKVNSAIIVMIVVPSHSDAYTLFESINYRGTPLSAIDLIKNMLLAKIDVSGEKDIDYYFSRWKDILENLGDDYSVQERFFRQNYNAFRKSLNEPFVKPDIDKQYPLGPIATRSTLLDIYEKLISEDPYKFLDAISENSEIYASIILNKTEDVSTDLIKGYQDIQRVGGAPAYLLLMYLQKNKEILKLDKSDFVKINKFLSVFFVRRNVTDVPNTRDLTRIFMSFVEEIENEGYVGKDIYNNLETKLKNVSANDSIFEEKLLGPIYQDNDGATRFILCALAEEGMTKETNVDLWSRTNSGQFIWTIEHIFPQGQKIPDCWVDMIADGDYSKAKEYQQLYVHTLGNLTITGYNSSLSNRSFEEKKERKDNKGNYIGYRNGLNLNSDVVDKDKWTIENIKNRTNDIVKRIIEKYKF